MANAMDILSWQYLLLLPLVYLVLDSVRVAYRTGLRKVPGPLLARFSKLWRFKFVMDGKAPFKYQLLHKKYGPIVRTGPNTVEISDPTVIPTIYGINTKFFKVWNRQNG